jgi:adenylate kinase family enzyme
MIVGGPGSGKSTLARALGARTGLPVRHMDLIHWQPGWVERDRAEKDRLTRAVHAEDAWIFEGGHSRTYDERAARADTLIWLDLPVGLRLWRVVRRWLTWWGRTRPDLPEDCPERLDPEFIRFILRTRSSARARIGRVVAEHPQLEVHRLRSPREVQQFLVEVGCPRVDKLASC